MGKPKIMKDVIHIYDKVLTRNFYFIIARDKSEFIKRAKKAFNINVETKGTNGAFLVICKNEGLDDCALVWSDDRSNTLMHECLHAAIWALEDIGVKISKDNDEILAYYQEFLFRSVKDY